ncbi:MAG: c-type cytochrome [Pseudomonadales bacterium]|nr:c-type cytochrome [Pseudomonadales bacterium]MDG1441542.1 c-type cytochrome [Pseudomonadales bacterium]
MLLRLLKWFSPVILLTALTACHYNPTDDYAIVEPVTLMSGQQVNKTDSKEIAHGQYLVTLLACGTCHTDGALVGKPDMAHYFAGSSIGVAYSNPFVESNPGVLYPPNITPDELTGIGSWSEEDLRNAIRSGIDRHGKRLISVMPWPGYATLSDEDVDDIVMYLRSLKAVRHAVPEKVETGTKASAPYVHFGVYQSKKNLQTNR